MISPLLHSKSSDMAYNDRDNDNDVENDNENDGDVDVKVEGGYAGDRVGDEQSDDQDDSFMDDSNVEDSGKAVGGSGGDNNSSLRSGTPAVGESKEAKRAHVENILSNMRQSPPPHHPHDTMDSSFSSATMDVKRQKRKQPQPQQHDAATMNNCEELSLQRQMMHFQEQMQAAKRKRDDDVSVDDENLDSDDEISSKPESPIMVGENTKRARVEHLLSSMRTSSSSPHHHVENGFDYNNGVSPDSDSGKKQKRKQTQPQQHDNSKVEALKEGGALALRHGVHSQLTSHSKFDSNNDDSVTDGLDSSMSEANHSSSAYMGPDTMFRNNWYRSLAEKEFAPSYHNGFDPHFYRENLFRHNFFGLRPDLDPMAALRNVTKNLHARTSEAGHPGDGQPKVPPADLSKIVNALKIELVQAINKAIDSAVTKVMSEKQNNNSASDALDSNSTSQHQQQHQDRQQQQQQQHLPSEGEEPQRRSAHPPQTPHLSVPLAPDDLTSTPRRAGTTTTTPPPNRRRLSPSLTSPPASPERLHDGGMSEILSTEQKETASKDINSCLATRRTPTSGHVSLDLQRPCNPKKSGKIEKGELQGRSPDMAASCRVSGGGRGFSVWGRYVGVLAVLTCILCLAGQAQARPASRTERKYRKLQSDTVKYLAQFGYLSGPSQETQNLRSKEDLVRAIKSLQRAGGLPETGVPDSRTEALMKKPRCGNMDDFAQTGIDHFSRKKRFIPGTSTWPRTNLTFRFVNYTPDMPQAQTRKLIVDALKVWTVSTPLTFTEVTDTMADIMILFAKKYHSDGHPFDGTGSVLAHAFFPGPGKGGDAHFDDDENWSTNSSGGIDLLLVAAHEFGHALGLGHSEKPSALMYPWYMGFEGEFELPHDDWQGITNLYGTGIKDRTFPEREKGKVKYKPNVPDGKPVYPEPTSPTAGDGPPDPCNSHIDALTVIRTEIFLFIGKWFWRLGPQKLINKPVEIHKFWYGLPKDLERIDAVFERPDNKIVFFSGDRFWVFNANHLLSRFPVEGRPITEFNIPADVKKIDAAFQWSYNKRTYLVSGDMYWKMDENNSFVEYDYPRDMGTWKGVPVPVDAAFMDQSGTTIFFQGLDYWQFYDMKMRVQRGYPRRISHYWSQCAENLSEREENLALERDRNLEVKTSPLDKGEGDTNLQDAEPLNSDDGSTKKDDGNGCTFLYLNSLMVILTLLTHYV
ncbi:uncharacterized protein LOC101848145 [Aplysia californica]|uniref:Uncharacterized protein LOC101848145 n=1 Tax=Aplysia californica TaxID=6500 RepID=A0ABM0K3F8_APLCA|nr:uncharacterized protein LOC101848145 [Aplysia californica]